MNTESKSKKYVGGFFVFAAAFSILIAGFNMLVDPYGVWAMVNRVGFNYYHTHKERFERINKPTDIMHQKPEVIFIGSSRVKFSLDPEKFTEITGQKNVYNLGVNGATIYEVRRFVEHAALNSPNLKEVVLGVDFFAFNIRQKTNTGFDDDQLSKTHLSKINIAKTTFSKEAVEASWDTLMLNRKEKRKYDVRFSNGLTTADEARHYRMDPDNFWTFSNASREFVNDDRLFKDYISSEESFADLQAIIDLCRKKDIHLIVYIAPVHALQMEAIEVSHVWEQYEAWKRRLTTMLPSYYDFSGYNEITTEAFSDRRTNFWDTSHITPKIGDLVLERMFSGRTEGLPAGFGFLVNQDTVEQDLLRLRQERAAWIEKNKALAQYASCFGGFIKGPLEALYTAGKREEILEARYEGIRGQRALEGTLAISRNDYFNLWGWAAGNGFSPGKQEIYMVLVSESNGTAYYVNTRQKDNPAVTAFFGDKDIRAVGVDVDCSLQNVPADDYRIHFEYMSDSTIFRSKPSSFILHIE